MMRLNTACWIAATAACFSLVASAQAPNAKPPAASNSAVGGASSTAGAGGAASRPTGSGGAAPRAAGATAGGGTSTGGAAGRTGVGGAATRTGVGAAAGAAGSPGTTSTAPTSASGTASATATANPSGSTSTTGATSAGTGAPATGATAAGAAGQPIDGSTYVVRLRDLEQRVDELKEQIRRSHTRLSLLSDTILSGGVGGARAELIFRNDLSSAFHLTGAVFVLDGVVQYNRQDESDNATLATQKEIPIFSGSIPPGDHTLQVVLRLRGHGYGVFSYLRGYKFEYKSSHSFTITEGKTVSLETIAWEKGDVTTPLEQRPAIRYVENLKSGVVPGTPASPGASPVRASTSTTTTPSSVSAGASIGTGAK